MLAIEQPDIPLGAGEAGTVSIAGAMIDPIQFAFDVDYNPERNEEMDVFLMSDATIVRNDTVRLADLCVCLILKDSTQSPIIQRVSVSQEVKMKKHPWYVYLRLRW